MGNLFKSRVGAVRRPKIKLPFCVFAICLDDGIWQCNETTEIALWVSRICLVARTNQQFATERECSAMIALNFFFIQFLFLVVFGCGFLWIRMIFFHNGARRERNNRCSQSFELLMSSTHDLRILNWEGERGAPVCSTFGCVDRFRPEYTEKEQQIFFFTKCVTHNTIG